MQANYYNNGNILKTVKFKIEQCKYLKFTKAGSGTIYFTFATTFAPALFDSLMIRKTSP